VRRASWNAMKPRIQCVLTQWKPGFIGSGSGPNAVKARIHSHPAGVRQRVELHDQLQPAALR
jgi:hypothetical protein